MDIDPKDPFKVYRGDRYVADFLKVMAGARHQTVATNLIYSLAKASTSNGVAHEILSVLTGFAHASTRREMQGETVVFPHQAPGRPGEYAYSKQEPVPRGKKELQRRTLEFNRNKNGGKPVLTLIKGDKE